MSDLFGNLPAELGRKQPSSQAEASALPTKRPRVESDVVGETQAAKRLRPGQDPVAQALVKLTSHISSSTKFNKASELLRQLMSEGRITSEHSRLVFEVRLQAGSLEANNLHGTIKQLHSAAFHGGESLPIFCHCTRLLPMMLAGPEGLQVICI